MSSEGSSPRDAIRYQPDEPPPAALALGLGLQLAVLTIPGIMLITTVVMRAAGETEAYLYWAVSATVAISGAATVLQAFRLGRFGTGHVLVMGSSGASIAVCIAAVSEGGPALLATLVFIAAFVPLLVAGRLSLLRRIVSPTVAGTVVMLIPVTVMPVVFDLLDKAPDRSHGSAAALSALATVLVTIGIALNSKGSLRLWAPLIGVVSGSAVAGFFGLYDFERVAAAPWIGFPAPQWPGFDLDFGAEFWALLPAFLLVALVGTLRTMSSCVAVQGVSWRRRRAVDFRAVQGAVATDGVTSLLSGFAGTVPSTAYTVSVSVIELTGAAARRVGVATGLVFIALVFLPKTFAVILAVPNPVLAGYLAILLALLFVAGMKAVVQDGLDYRKGMVAGVAFWVGVGCQHGMIFPDQVPEFAGGLFRNGMIAGGLVAIAMTLFLGMTEPRRKRLETELGLAALPEIREFLTSFASREGWGSEMAARLDAVGEEALLTLIRDDEDGAEPGGRQHFRLTAQRGDGGATLEFVVAPRGENLQDRLALLHNVSDEAPLEREVSLRLLRHLAASVRHQQYHDMDVVTVNVKGDE
ncbi:MAG: hypothetical protein OXC28_21775 [Defluviicoccus sp.]|nr:hypothetical protein [Defluviicoccus sp.]